MWDKALLAVCSYFRSLGYLQASITKQSAVLRPSDHALVTPGAARMITLATQLQVGRKNRDSAMVLEQLARKHYLVVNGGMTGYRPCVVHKDERATMLRDMKKGADGTWSWD